MPARYADGPRLTADSLTHREHSRSRRLTAIIRAWRGTLGVEDSQIHSRQAWREPIATTGQLVSVILAAVPAAARRWAAPARRTFQALRIAVNDELGAVRRGVETAIALAAHGGRVVTLSHSLEDRIIKEIFRTGMAPCTCGPAALACVCGKRPGLERASLKPVVPSYEEIQKNPRSRSAKSERPPKF